MLPLEIRKPTDVPPNEIGPAIALAPDGSYIVYVGADPEVAGTTALWKRPLDRLDAAPIVGTRGGQWPTVMPDGRSIQFMKRDADGTDNERWEVSAEGGLPTLSRHSRAGCNGCAMAASSSPIPGTSSFGAASRVRYPRGRPP
jgi:hypothetical protein